MHARATYAADLPTGLDGDYDPHNPFAQIIRGELPASKVYDDADVLVITPLTMLTPGHVLVIPKRLGVRNLLGLTADEMRACLVAVQKAALAQRRALGSTGFRLHQTNGATSDQDVFHPHFHVIPSFGPSPAYRDTVDRNRREELDAMAAKLKAAWPE